MDRRESYSMGSRRVENRRKPPNSANRKRGRGAAAAKRQTAGGRISQRRKIAGHHQSRQKTRRLFMARIRAAVMLVLSVTIICSVVLLTPLFDIKNITVSGNGYVPSDEIQTLLIDIKGKNLVTTSKKEIIKSVKANKYIDEIRVWKKPFPPTIVLTVSEHIPLCYLQSGNKLFAVDKNMYIIDETDGAAADNLTCITGVRVKSAKAQSRLTVEDADTENALKSFLRVMSGDEIIQGIISLDLSDTGNITFNYENRITALCGSSADLEKKLWLFKSSITNKEMKPNAHGTIDLTTVGYAEYIP